MNALVGWRECALVGLYGVGSLANCTAPDHLYAFQVDGSLQRIRIGVIGVVELEATCGLSGYVNGSNSRVAL